MSFPPPLPGISCGLLLLLPALHAQGRWRSIPTFNSRSGMNIAYDPLRKVAVAFGTVQSGYNNTIHAPAETWEWDGKDWKRRNPLHSPPDRFDAGMAYSPKTKKIILFAGMAPKIGKLYNDTWAWDGKDWKQIKTTLSPTGRRLGPCQMVTEFKRQRIVLHGGDADATFGFPKPLGDTWEFDGSQWIPRTAPGPTPWLRYAHRMVSDPKTGLTYLFGTSGWTNKKDNKTWAWNGKTWAVVDKGTGPSPRFGGYWFRDPVTGELLHFAGYAMDSFGTFLNELWAWNGKSWKLKGKGVVPKTSYQQLWPALGGFVDLERKAIYVVEATDGLLHSTQTLALKKNLLQPVSRYQMPEVAFYHVELDQERDQFLILGEGKGPKANVFPPQTWVWSNSRFTRLNPKKSPPPFYPTGSRTMVYHPGIKKTLLVANFLPGSFPAKQTWLWDGKNWSEFKDPNQPLSPIASVYDSGRDCIVVYAYDGTWEWRPKGWQRVLSRSKTPAGGSICYDPRLKRVLFFGDRGRGASETWTYDGKVWTRFTTKTLPPSRFWQAMAYDPRLGGVVMAGGVDATRPFPDPLSDTWLFDGKDWRQLKVEPLPVVVNAGIKDLVYDSRRQRLLAFYPQNLTGWIQEHTFETLRLSDPHPRPGESFRFEVSQANAPGQVFLLGLSLSHDSGISLYSIPNVGSVAFPLDPDHLLLWSLSGPLFTTLDGKGNGSLLFRIPKDPRLAGISLFSAGLAFDPKNQWKLGFVSNLAEIQITR